MTDSVGCPRIMEYHDVDVPCDINKDFKPMVVQMNYSFYEYVSDDEKCVNPFWNQYVFHPIIFHDCAIDVSVFSRNGKFYDCDHCPIETINGKLMVTKFQVDDWNRKTKTAIDETNEKNCAEFHKQNELSSLFPDEEGY